MRETISSSVDQHLTRFSHDFFPRFLSHHTLLQLFLPEKMRAKPIEKKTRENSWGHNKSLPIECPVTRAR